jgi:hypothetical protein
MGVLIISAPNASRTQSTNLRSGYAIAFDEHNKPICDPVGTKECPESRPIHQVRPRAVGA